MPMNAARGSLLGAAFACLGLLGGCAPGADPDARVLAVGDSVLAWNRGARASIPEVAARALGLDVINAAVPGARVIQPSPLRAALGLSVPAQVVPGPRDWAIVNGGANDLSSACGCTGCDAALDALVSPDGSVGAMPDLVRQVQAAGAARVAVLGYYGPSQAGGGSFAACDDEFAALDVRLARMASARPGVIFVPTRAVVAGSPALYARDRVHPSVAGSDVIGKALADAMARSVARPVAIAPPAR
jgi:lysophospholipase L1-like esterase